MVRQGSRGARGAALLSLALALVAAAPASAAEGGDEVLSPLAFEVLDPPQPVRAADGRNHLVYEIKIANQSPRGVTVLSVQPRARGRSLGPALEGGALAAVLRRDGGDEGATLAPGEGATLFMDADYRRRAKAPKRIRHRISIRVEPAGPDPAQQLSFGGVPSSVGRREAFEVEPPLRGQRWYVSNGCCAALNAHRGATLAIDGTVHVPERFAIDFVQLDSRNRLFSGPLDELSSYAYYGAKVRSVAAGKVVRVQDGLPEQVPGALPPDATVQTAGGNYVVVRIARGVYAFYAHLQTDSPRVRRGDRVRAGQVLGLLGNTGNTDAPHLHFHLMDSPSPLESNGLPYTFTRFRGEGVATDEGPLQTGVPVPIDSAALAGPHRDRLPLDGQLVEFPRR